MKGILRENILYQTIKLIIKKPEAVSNFRLSARTHGLKSVRVQYKVYI
jgi:hypothetical protein